MSFTLCDISKLPPAMQRAALADQERASAARERVMAQCVTKNYNGPLLAFPGAHPVSLPAPHAETPAKPLSVPARGLLKGPKVKHEESKAQQAVVKWFDLHACEWNLEPELLMAFPLQGKRSKASGGRLKAEGMRKGTLDLQLCVPRGDCCSLWIEMKSSTGKLSESQKLMLKRLTAIGAATVVCRSAMEAQAAITAYLNLPSKQ